MKQLPLVFLLLSISIGYGVAQPTQDFATLYLYQPKSKKETIILLNDKSIYIMGHKSRLVFKIYSTGVLRISNQGKSAVVQLQVETGKKYYLQTEGSGKDGIVLVEESTAVQAFHDASVFSDSPVERSESLEDPIPRMSISLERIRFANLALKEQKTLVAKEREIQNQVESYFNELKKENKLNKSVSPQVLVRVEEAGSAANGRQQYNLRTAYSYDVTEKGISAELINYPPGIYQIEKSPGAMATVAAIQKSIQDYLAEYFEPGGVIRIRIIGSADSSPLRGSNIYTGEFKNFSQHRYDLINEYGIEFLKQNSIDGIQKFKPQKRGSENAVTLIQGDPIESNQQLAFLRSYGIRHYIEQSVPLLKKTKNIFLHQAKLENGVGGEFRKVVVEIVIEDFLRSK